MCVFDYDNVESGYSYGCHFTVFDGTKCYLGSIGYEGNLVASITGNELHFKQSKYQDVKWLLGDYACIIIPLPTLDAFQADSTASIWFAHTPATSTHRDDVSSYIFKQLSHHSYQNDDCAGNFTNL